MSSVWVLYQRHLHNGWSGQGNVIPASVTLLAEPKAFMNIVKFGCPKVSEF